MRSISSHALGVFVLALFVIGLCGCPWDHKVTEQAGMYVSAHAVVDIGGNEIPLSPQAGASISGFVSTPEGGIGTRTRFAFTTDPTGVMYFGDAQVPAIWTSTIIGPCPIPVSTLPFDVTFEDPNIAWICAPSGTLLPYPNFVLTGSFPGTITVPVAGFSVSSGMPTAYVYNQGGLIATETASSVAPDGSSATFPFPSTTSNGYPLGSGWYSINVGNGSSAAGNYSFLGVGMFSVGAQATSQTTPYGITAFDDTTWSSNCMSDSWYGTYCSGGQGSKPDYSVTLASPGQVCFEGSCANVGAEPVDVRTFGSGTGQDYHEDDGCNDVGSGEIQCFWIDSGWNGPGYAITADYASNTATIVNLASMSVVATIPVGTNPMAVVLDSSQANAYVANFGSASISQVSLSSDAVVRTIAVGTNPAALALDPSGNSLWVGGLNYMANVRLSDFAVTNYGLEGQATSVAISQAQNSWLCTMISNDLSTFETQDAPLSNPSSYSTDVSMPTSGTDYAGGGTSSTPPPYLKAGAAVSATYGNGIAVTSTPTGFAVIDLVSHQIIEQGTTPGPLRGIATDPAQGVAYLTAPESDSVITVPLPIPD